MVHGTDVLSLPLAWIHREHQRAVGSNETCQPARGVGAPLSAHLLLHTVSLPHYHVVALEEEELPLRQPLLARLRLARESLEHPGHAQVPVARDLRQEQD